MTNDELITRLGEISIQCFTVGRTHGLAELENLSMQMNELVGELVNRGWCAGMPTEEGLYLCAVRIGKKEIDYEMREFVIACKKYPMWMPRFLAHEILAWQKIVPYTGE